MKHEAAFTTRFRRWAGENIGTGAYEIKHTRGEVSFRMDELKEHQVDALRAAKGPYGLAYKIPDEGFAYRPFDMFVLRKAAAWVVIAYPAGFVVIDIDKLLTWKEPSLQYADAVGLATFTRPFNAL